MTIIIETPAPPTRERLVLVPPSCVTEEYESQAGPRLGITGGVARDATPADLERGGFAPLSAFVGPLDLLSPPTLAGALEAIGGIQKDADRWEGELATVKRDYADIQRQLGEERERAETAEAARDALRDQITAAGCEAAHAGERTYECDVARPCGLCRLRTRAEKAERERDEATARNDERLRSGGVANYVADLRAERDTLRAEVARLTAPGEGSEGGPWRAYGEPTDQELVDAFEHAYSNAPSVRTHATAIRTIYRLGVAHERARQQPEKGRATDEELVDLYRKVYETHGGGTIDVSHDDCRRAAVLAVAAHVRQGRCLVAQAVGRGVDVHVTEFVPTQWRVVVVDREATSKTAPCSAADVPATLARLLGEVSRG
jgi:hypothetical protein